MTAKAVGTVCRYCGKETTLGERLVWCDKCSTVHHQACWSTNGGCSTADCSGKPVDSVVTERTVRTISKMFGVAYTAEAVGKLCPYCQTQIEHGEDAMVCARCQMPHHTSCWHQNGGCTTYGCVPQVLRKMQQDAPSTHIDLSGMRFKKNKEEEIPLGCTGGFLGAAAGLVLGLVTVGGFYTVIVAAVGAGVGVLAEKIVVNVSSGWRK